MSVKILPLCIRPRILHSTPVTVYSIAVMLTVKDYLAWHYSNFIQLRCDRQVDQSMKLDYYIMPMRF